MAIHENKEIWVFLSHSIEDYDKVRKVRNMLEDQELRPIMFFLKCLSDDDDIDELIKREIDCRTRFILCDSENAKKSKWVQMERKHALQLIREGKSSLSIYPLCLRPEAPLPLDMSDKYNFATL